MSEECINRTYLETLSFSDLSNLADKYGIDVPENLNRRFLIAELLEIVDEFSNNQDDMQISSDVRISQDVVLPKNYNESQVSCVLRNPAWLFVFWNISDNDHKLLKSAVGSSLKLRICSMSSLTDMKAEEAFEVQCSNGSQEQYVLLPQGKKYIKVELICVNGTTTEVLAFTPIIDIPQVSNLEENLKLGTDSQYPEIIKLSGINEVLMNQYNNHRQSFL